MSLVPSRGRAADAPGMKYVIAFLLGVTAGLALAVATLEAAFQFGGDDGR